MLPRAVLINLPRDTDRLRNVEKQLSNARVSFERAQAVDGAALTHDELCAHCTPLARHLLTRGTVGCALSHINCWRMCADSEAPLLVFEDDVELVDGFREKVEAAMAALDGSAWDVLLLGALGAVRPSDDTSGGAARLQDLVMPLLLATAGGLRYDSWRAALPGGGLLHVPRRAYCTHAYIVSPQGARKLLATCSKVSFHIDVVAWGRPGVRLLIVHPLLASQAHGDSTLGGTLLPMLPDSWARALLPDLTLDEYTGAKLLWALRGPIFQLRPPHGPILTIAGSLLILLWGLAAAAILRSLPVLLAVAGYVVVLSTLIRVSARGQAPRL